MRLFLGVLGWYLLIVGGLLCAKPVLGKRLADVWMKDKIHRGWALVTVTVGLLFLWAAPSSRAILFIQILGWLTILKGAYLLVGPRKQLMRIVEWWHGLPQGGLRVWGLVSLAVGLAILAAR